MCVLKLGCGEGERNRKVNERERLDGWWGVWDSRGQPGLRPLPSVPRAELYPSDSPALVMRTLGPGWPPAPVCFPSSSGGSAVKRMKGFPLKKDHASSWDEGQALEARPELRDR